MNPNKAVKAFESPFARNPFRPDEKLPRSRVLEAVGNGFVRILAAHRRFRIEYPWNGVKAT
ncbi:MAG: hypothetical protein NT080_10375 [Spirochaetes bacterium]|nr:hypothetical protein [Spirochaetota bacterium]